MKPQTEIEALLTTVKIIALVIIVIAVFSGCGGSDAPIHEHHPLNCSATPEQCK